MRIYIVTADIDDRGCVPYYGSFVSVMGVYTTREQAVKRARNHRNCSTEARMSRYE